MCTPAMFHNFFYNDKCGCAVIYIEWPLLDWLHVLWYLHQLARLQAETDSFKIS